MHSAKIPMVMIEEIFDEKREICCLLISRSRLIEEYINTFRDTVDLIEHINQHADSVEIPLKYTSMAHEGTGSFGHEMTQRRKHASWAAIALRDGATTLAHIDCVIQSLTEEIISNLEGLVETSILRSGIELFKESFPSARHTRNSIAHRSEDQSDPKKAERNALKEGEYDYGMKVGSNSRVNVEFYSGNNISFSRREYGGGDADFVSVSIGRESLSKLDEVLELIVSSIKPLADKTVQAGYKTFLSERGIDLPPDQGQN